MRSPIWRTRVSSELDARWMHSSSSSFVHHVALRLFFSLWLILLLGLNKENADEMFTIQGDVTLTGSCLCGKHEVTISIPVDK
jgi:hypothetical protein